MNKSNYKVKRYKISFLMNFIIVTRKIIKNQIKDIK
jgi:hypothetical protein